jgi:D-tyrosyl-tRNA(Tyr) deacylase
MRAVLQRVSEASVTVGDELVGRIATGWLALVGVTHADTAADTGWLADKVAHLRAFPDADGKMNLDVQQVGGAVLVVSNFTLYADAQKGRRPSFVAAARPEQAEPLVRAFADGLRRLGVPVETGRFGADMRVALANDGPVTLVLDSRPAVC